MEELLIAVNPDPDSRLPCLLRLPLGAGMVFRTCDTWPRTKALYCYPLQAIDWPAEPDIIQRAPIRSCVRRGAAIDLVLDRGRENRSQLVFTKARGRDLARRRLPEPSAVVSDAAPLNCQVAIADAMTPRVGGSVATTR